jgi:Ca2+-binding RTX toxin-like protein
MTFTTVAGTGGSPDSFFGTQGIDTISLNTRANGAWLGARQADDVITIAATASRYTLNAGAGNDTITCQAASTISDSRVFGDAGGDTINIAAVSNSTVSGGQGIDSISTAGLVSSALINGNQGADQININAGATNSSIFGGIDDDTITITTRLVNSKVKSNEGVDNITIAAGTTLQGSTVNGNAGNDTITVNAIAAFANSMLFGGTGNDSINANNARVGVLVSGDAGNDDIVGGTGNDTLIGGTGNDSLFGGLGIDSYQVDAGVDSVGELGEGGADVVVTSVGATANGTVTVDWVATANTTNAGLATFTSNAAGIDINLALATGANGYSIVGSTGAETLVGSAQADTITGANGADALDGGAGVDSFVQADGSSVIWTAQNGVVGNVIVAGGVFTFGNSTDVITNFAAGAGGDGINVTTANNLTTLAAAAATNALNVASNYLVRGTWNAGARTFTQANAGADALILFNAQNAAFENAGNDNFIIATGVGATLVAANFT